MSRHMARHFHGSQTDPCAHETGTWQDPEPAGNFSAGLTVLYLAAFITVLYLAVIWAIVVLGQ